LLTDEEPRGGGPWRALIAVVILAVVGYLVLKNWDSPTFAAAIAQIQKRTQSASTPDAKPQQPPSTEQPSISTDESSASSEAEKQGPKPAQESANGAKQDAQKPASANIAGQDKSGSSSTDNSTSNKDEIANSKEAQKSGSAIPEDDRNNDTESAVADETKSEKSGPSTEGSRAAGIPAQDLYERGQAYLSGHGAPQSCDQGVVYTRASAQQGNPKAAVQMGALYATGRCVSQDRVQAYNWFNEALRNDPNNEYVERSRSTLWAQMTEEERQRAAKNQ
jgi:TPR repeat protein